MGLTSITLPASLSTIRLHTFSFTTYLETLNVGEKCTKIDEYAFNSSGIKTLNLPSSINYIGNYAFANCRNLDIRVIPTNVFELSIGSFANCTSIYEINLSNVQVIKSFAFQHCLQLTKIIIPDNSNFLESNSFESCTSLCSVTIGSNCIVNISAFSSCSKIHSIIFKDNCTIKGFAFNSSQNISTIGLYDNVIFEESALNVLNAGRISVYYMGTNMNVSEVLSSYIYNVFVLEEYSKRVFLYRVPQKLPKSKMVSSYSDRECRYFFVEPLPPPRPPTPIEEDLIETLFLYLYPSVVSSK
ncbi:surface antigen BspA-like [Trichomonas vaginalis G3]|uniref:Surface antigen BspA-like n=1 Tax=Trichomonas vaginalis (strain ATCC PRA-98 / G3) TaxID=412133 RepID=A2F2A8_TRIV3|nr:antigen BSP-related family [Trichomonas vaginalis G3]EAY00987.1 surface antigen BspA-like [Trichomonas vaginalis G3]KAI5516793.1 antigen BSP-related family [Trichomonas vaginalis G3]|eukprot:XP_001330058.1 surface antigen BspA-like [Trichomonas vaginalis G3]